MSGWWESEEWRDEWMSHNWKKCQTSNEPENLAAVHDWLREKGAPVSHEELGRILAKGYKGEYLPIVKGD